MPSGTPNAMPSELCVEGVSKRFGGLVAVSNLSLTLRAGTIHGLIGPNGAGKSTTIALLSGFQRPNEGTISFDGVDLTRLSPWSIAQHGISRTFQQATPLPGLSVFDNVLVGMHTRFQRHERAPLREQARAVLKRFELEELATSDAQALTFGQLRFLEIARAAVMRPKLLLLDEPAAGLNDVERRRLADIVTGLRSDGIGVLLIDHDVPFVFGLCDTLTVMDFGSVIAEGRPDTVRSNPAVVSAYLGGTATVRGS